MTEEGNHLDVETDRRRGESDGEVDLDRRHAKERDGEAVREVEIDHPRDEAIEVRRETKVRREIECEVDLDLHELEMIGKLSTER